MKQPRQYIDLFKMAREAGHHTDVQWGNIEEVLQQFLSRIGVLVLPSFLFYMLDLVQGKYLAVGPGTNTFLGYTTGQLRDRGPFGYFEQWHPDDWNTLNKRITPDQLKATAGMPSAQQQLLIQSNYRVRKKDSTYCMLAQHSSHIEVTAEGFPLAVVGVVMDISHFNIGNRIIHRITAFDGRQPANIAGKVLMDKVYFTHIEEGQLTHRETEVIKWLCDGMSSAATAAKMHISIHTINNHRKSILQKTGAKNMLEVVAYAVKNNLI